MHDSDIRSELKLRITETESELQPACSSLRSFQFGPFGKGRGNSAGGFCWVGGFSLAR